jgi:hypothetical protein
MAHSPLSSQARLELQQRFCQRYLVLTGVLTGLAIAGVAWHWNQPKSYGLGFSYAQSVPVLLVAAVLVNGIAFYFQYRYVHRLLRRAHPATDLQPARFALRYYFYHLATAVGLSVVGFFPLLALLFFYWIYPVVFWLIPYPLIAGFILGWDLEKEVRSLSSSSQKESVS